MTPIAESRQSPFAEYLFKLIDDYKAKHNGKAPILSSKVLSDLRKGNTNIPTKRNVIATIFNLRLSVDESYTLLAKANYTFSKYPKCNEEIKFDQISIQYIDAQNFDKDAINEELYNNFLKRIKFKYKR